MTEEQGGITPAIRKQGILKGIILGVIRVALNIFTFYFITVLTKSPVTIIFGLGFFQFILPIAFAVVFTILIRQSIGGYWNLRQAITGIFFMLFISFAILTIGRDWIFGKLIEPHMLDKTEVAMESSSLARFQAQKLPQKQIDERMADMRTQFAIGKKATFFDDLRGYLETTLLMFVGAFILGAIFKREAAQTAKPV